jgi:hypothetical protein
MKRRRDPASARRIEEDILQIAAPITCEKFRWRRVIDEAALFQHDHPIAQAFDLRFISVAARWRTAWCCIGSATTTQSAYSRSLS